MKGGGWFISAQGELTPDDVALIQRGEWVRVLRRCQTTQRACVIAFASDRELAKVAGDGIESALVAAGVIGGAT